MAATFRVLGLLAMLLAAILAQEQGDTVAPLVVVDDDASAPASDDTMPSGISAEGEELAEDDEDAEIVSAPDHLPPSAPGPLDDCDPEMVGFELVTGYVFSAPGNVLDSIPGTLMLTDCLETCQGNDSCQSVNYETGLCVLFSSHADVLPGK